MQTKTITFFLLLIIATSVWGQVEGQTTNKKKALKIFLNNTRTVDWLPNFSLMANKKNTNTTVGLVSNSISFFSFKDNFHEVELNDLYINKNTSEQFISGNSQLTNTFKSSLVSLGYSYNHKLLKKKENKRLNYYLGVGVAPLFSTRKTTSSSSSVFPNAQQNLEASLYFTPRININLKGNWFLDINTPINIVEYRLERNKIDNPLVPIENRVTTNVNVSSFPNRLLLKVGIGVRV